jgi:hypothetical protein
MPNPERSVKRPIRSAGSPSTTSRVIGSKRRERRLSRCGTRRIRWDAPEVVKGTLGIVGGWGVPGTTAATCGVLEDASAPPERRLLRICVRPEEMGRLFEREVCRPGAAVERRL